MSGTTTECSNNVQRRLHHYNCGRWSLRWTKSRQDRAVRNSNSKNKRKRSSPCQSSAGNSSSSENELPSSFSLENLNYSATSATSSNYSKSWVTDETTSSASDSTGEVCQKLPNASNKEVFPGIFKCARVLDKLEGINDCQYVKAMHKIGIKTWRREFMALPTDRKVDLIINLP